MLLEKKNYAVGDIITIKLLNGDEVVGKLTRDDPASYTIAKPIVIAMQMVGPHQAKLGFAPFLASADDDQTFSFQKSIVMAAPVKTRSDVSDNYLRAISSIEMPPKPTLIGV